MHSGMLPESWLLERVLKDKCNAYKVSREWRSQIFSGIDPLNALLFNTLVLENSNKYINSLSNPILGGIPPFNPLLVRSLAINANKQM